MYQNTYSIIEEFKYFDNSIYHLLNGTYYCTDNVKLEKPTCLAIYAVKKSSNQTKTIIEDEKEIDDLFLKYSLDQFEERKELNLELDFDLGSDFTADVLRPSRKLDPILKIILKKKSFFQQQSNSGKLIKLGIDFLSYRSTFTHLLQCKYTPKLNFIIHAELFNETIYLQLEEFKEEEFVSDRFTLAGLKFEMCCTKEFDERKKSSIEDEEKSKTEDDTKSSSDESKTQIDLKSTGDQCENERKKFEDHVTKDLCFIFKNRIGNHSLMYSAEMDCFESYVNRNELPMHNDQIKSVELKTSKKTRPNSAAENNFLRFKTLKWWSQSKLVDVKNFCVGFRRDDLIVDEIKEFTLDEIASMSRWSPDVCMYQMNEILSYIKNCFKESKETKLRFRYDSLSTTFICKSSTKSLLPDYYKNEFEAL